MREIEAGIEKTTTEKSLTTIMQYQHDHGKNLDASITQESSLDRSTRRDEQSKKLNDNLANIRELEEQKRQLEQVVSSYRG